MPYQKNAETGATLFTRQMNANTQAFLSAHATPFAPASTWPAKPRIPDGAQGNTQIVQIRFQTSINVDTTGEFHVVVQGDPIQAPLPIIDHTMFSPWQEWQVGTVGKVDPLVSDQSWKPFMESVEEGQVPNSLLLSGTPPAANPPYAGRVELYRRTLTNCATAYENTYKNYLDALSNLALTNSAYRIIGQATRLWSLQGELQNQTGIIRAATIDTNMWNMNTELRTAAYITDHTQYQLTLINDTLLPVSATYWASAAPCWLNTQTTPINTKESLAADSTQGGIYRAMITDALSAAGDIKNPTYWKSYLKNVTEASEHAFSYKIFDGRGGVSCRSEYCRPMIPFRSLKSRNLLIPNQYSNGVTNAVVGCNLDGTIVSYQVKSNGSVAAGMYTPAMGMYEALMLYTNQPQVPLFTQAFINGATPPVTGPVGLTYGLGHTPGAANQFVSSYNDLQQTTVMVGEESIQNGLVPVVDSNDQFVDGYHFHGYNFQPSTPTQMNTMYLEHVVNIEVVPTAQQTGVMSEQIAVDPSFHHALVMCQDRDAFPRIVKGHSFWSSIWTGVKKFAHKVSASPFSKILNVIPGGGLLTGALGGIDALSSAIGQSKQALASIPPHPVLQVQQDPGDNDADDGTYPDNNDDENVEDE